MNAMPQVTLASVAPHLREWDGLKRIAYEGSGEVRFSGCREALEASDLVPLGTPFPGEVPGARGIRWKDDAGRRHVLSRLGARLKFMLTVYPTAAEKMLLVDDFRAGKELAKVEKEMASLDVTSEKFRSQVWQIMCASSLATKQLMFGGKEGWRYEACIEEEFYDLMGQLYRLIHESPVARNNAVLNGVRRRHAALSDYKFRRSMLKVITGSAS